MKAKKVLSLLTAAALVVGATPLRSFAQDDATYQDGVYTGTATVQPDEDEDFDAYDIEVNVTIQDGKITDIAYANADTFDSDNVSYANRALNGRGSKPGLISKMTEANSADVDTVGGATCSSDGVITAVKAALAQAVVTEEPTTETPETEEPATEAPETEEPETEEPTTEALETEAPATEAPETEEPTTEAETPVAQSGYVLINIPYAEFYAAEVQNSIPVDSVSSATLVKTRGTLSQGSYHVNPDGSEITGVIFPVKVDDLSVLAAYKQVTDADSFSITTTNRGNTTTVDYVGKDALFENSTYAYYVLDSAPSYYKELTVTDGAFSFGPVIGDVTTSDATAELTTTSNYGDYEIDIDGLDVTPNDDTVYAVVLKTVEGDSYGLRHLENIWRVSELAWSTGFTTSVHGSPTSSAHYVSMMGQTINEIVYYTSKGIYSINTNLYVPVKLGDVVSVADSNAGTGAATVSFSKALPEDFTPVYTVNDLAVSYADGVLSYTDAAPGAYTLTITDASGKYAALSTSFQLIIDIVPAAYNAQNAAPALVPVDGVSAEDFATYVSAITSVTVNDTAYAASGKRATKVILDDGTVDTSVDAFTEGTNTVTVTAAGYPDLTFTIEKAVPASYILLNIPYAEFYAAEVQNSVPVDSVSSATLVKTRGTLSQGSYHVNPDGSEITGVIFPVKVDDLSVLAAYKQVTDADSFSITTTNRGNTTTVDYVGKDALFENSTYAYYVLDSAPSYYKELTVTDGAFSFGPVIGDVTTSDATAELTTTSNYGDYEIDIDGLDVTPNDDTVYAVVLKTVEGDSYGLRHLENIWRVSELAWSTGFTTSVHGSPTSSAHYVSMMGQTINEIVYYTSKGIYSINTNLYVPVKLGDVVSVADSNAGTGAATVSFSKALPEDFTPVYTVNDLAVSYADGVLSYTDAAPGAYTLTITDASGKYAALSTSFQLIIDIVPAAYNAQNAAPALVPVDGVSAEDFATYVSAITSVTVNDTAYAASGKRATKVILDDGTVDTSVDAFTEGANTVTVTAAGYPELTFVIDTTANETEPSTEETEPSSEVTEPSTEETEPSTEATEPSTEETEPSTEATEPSTEETEPSTEETEPSTEDTKASLDEGEAGATGDISSAYLWSMLLLLGGASCAAYTVTRKKEEE